MKSVSIARHVIVSIVALTFLPLAGYAHAQGAVPNPPAPGGASATQGSDLPGRVARLNYFAGTVTYEPAGGSDWAYASLNRPMTTGDQIWNDRGARSEMHVGSTAVRLGEQTSVEILSLDDANAQLKVAQGTLSTHVRALPPGQTYEIDTPNVALAVGGPGDYRVDVAPDGSSTTVTVRDGSVTAYGDSGSQSVSAGQQVRYVGTDLQTELAGGAPGLDAFDQWASSRDAAEDRSVSARYVSRDIPGYQDLDANGNWRDDPTYGEVWVPSAVPSDWAPYRDGHWIWQAPWGWTWVDDAPWGFAPYHYGRWAYVDDAWAWVPGPIVAAAPCYAPALVAFVGRGGRGVDWGVSLAIGGAAAAGVAWFPLGPGERWHPHWAGRGDRYFERVNRTVVINNVHNRTIVNNATNVHNTYVNYRAPGAVTAVPATAFVHGQPIGRYAQRVDPRQWRDVRINPGTPGIAPVKESFGAGLRHADYRPPQALAQRQVVATRAPVQPAVFHDGLAQRFAQQGGRVPGAGAPMVHTEPMRTNFAGMPQRGAPNVKLVNARPGVPVVPAVPREGGWGGPQVGMRPGGPAATNAHPANPGAVAARPHDNGVPRPPQAYGHAGAAVPVPRQEQAGQPRVAPNGVPHAQQWGNVPQHGQPQTAQAQQQQRMPFDQQRAPTMQPHAQPGQQHAPVPQQQSAQATQPQQRDQAMQQRMQMQVQRQQAQAMQQREQAARQQRMQAEQQRAQAMQQQRDQALQQQRAQMEQQRAQAMQQQRDQAIQQQRAQMEQQRAQMMQQQRDQAAQQQRMQMEQQRSQMMQQRQQLQPQPRNDSHSPQRPDQHSAVGGGRDEHRRG